MISSGNLSKAEDILAISFAFAVGLTSIVSIGVIGDFSSTSDARGGDEGGDTDAAMLRDSDA